jgi:hypothetical protein
MDTELKAYLEAMEGRLLVKIEKFEALHVRIGDRLDALDAKIEKVKTTLLTEFHKWASPHEARLRTHAATLRAIDLE